MSNRTRNLHAWRTRLPDGRKREVRAQLFGSKWSLTARCSDEEDWTPVEKPPLDDLVELESILFKKYQRKHGPWEHVLGVRKLIEAMEG